MGHYSKRTDADLIGLLKNGDQLAFTEIYNRYWALLYSHSRRMLRNDEEAMDVVQDVFTIFWKKAPELAPISSLRAYLYTAIRNTTLNAINKSKKKDDYLNSLANFLESGENLTDNEIAFNELTIQIEKEIENLPPKMRQIFDMSRNLGISHKQIAEELNITDHTVKKQSTGRSKSFVHSFRQFFTCFYFKF